MSKSVIYGLNSPKTPELDRILKKNPFLRDGAEEMTFSFVQWFNDGHQPTLKEYTTFLRAAIKARKKAEKRRWRNVKNGTMKTFEACLDQSCPHKTVPPCRSAECLVCDKKTWRFD